MSHRRIILVIVAILSISLSPNSLHAQTPVLVFSHDFEGSSPMGNITPQWDASVACPSPYASSSNDVSAYVVIGGIWPGHGQALTVHANDNNEPATSANSLAVKSFNYQGSGVYQPEVDMRLWRMDTVGNIQYKAQYFGVNLSFGRNTNQTRFAEVNVEANPSSPDYGWLMYKTNHSPIQRYRIVYVGVNTNWHNLLINVHIDVPSSYYKLLSVRWDGQWYTIPTNIQTLPLWTNPGWGNYNHFFVETGNAYNGCNPNITTVGIGVFDNMKMNYYSW